MARTTLLAICLGLALPAARAGAQEACTIRLKPAGADETTRCEDILTTDMTTRQVDVLGLQAGKRSDHSVRRAVYDETVLERDPATGQVKRLRRQCDRATLEVNKQESALPYHCRTFTVERGPEGCRVHFEGPPPSPEFVKELEEGFRLKKDLHLVEALLPGRAVKPGETWSFDVRPLLRAWPKPAQVRLDESKCTATGKLSQVYRKGGRLFGVLEFTAEVPVLAVDLGTRAAVLEPEARLTYTLTVDACIDGGASTFSLRLQDELLANVRLPAPAGQRITGTLSEQHVRTETRP